MCHAVIEVKLRNESKTELTRMATKDELAKKLVQLERQGTVEKIVIFLNHHTHRLTENWVDEMYVEPAQQQDVVAV